MGMRDYLDDLKTKPIHVRRSVAFSAAGALSLLVAAGWGAALLSSGVLAFEEQGASTAGISVTAREFRDASAGIAGAAAAFTAPASAGGVTVINATASSTLDKERAPEATIIPF